MERSWVRGGRQHDKQHSRKYQIKGKPPVRSTGHYPTTLSRKLRVGCGLNLGARKAIVLTCRFEVVHKQWADASKRFDKITAEFE